MIFAAISALFPIAAQAHSGKARFHIIVDTDCAADDLRTLCMLLGNREIEVLAVTTSEGALPPRLSARRAKCVGDSLLGAGSRAARREDQGYGTARAKKLS